MRNNSSFSNLNNSSIFNIEPNGLGNKEKSALELESFNSSSSYDPTNTFEFGGDTYALGEYQIQEGDTLNYLAKETMGDSSVFGVIASINGIEDPNQIFAGQQILLPMSVYTLEEEIPQESVGVYKVGEGDTLAEIAQQIVGDASAYTELAEYNNISNPNYIFEGQEIEIPVQDAKPIHRGYDDSDILLPSLKQGEGDDLGIVETAVQAQADNINSVGAKEVTFTPAQEDVNELGELAYNVVDVVGNVAKGLDAGLNGDFVIKDTRVGATIFEAKNGKPKLPIGFTQDQFAEFSQGLREGTKNYSQDVVMQGSRVTGFSYNKENLIIPVKPTSDLDIGVRVDDKRFGEVLENGGFKRAKPGNAVESSKNYAIANGKINAKHAKYSKDAPLLKTFRDSFTETFEDIGTEVRKIDLSVVQQKTKFDVQPNIQAALPLKSLETVVDTTTEASDLSKTATKYIDDAAKLVAKAAKPVGVIADTLGKVAKPIGIAADVYTLGNAVYEDGGTIGNNTAKEATKIAADWAGSAAGGMTGAKIGAAIGTMFVPGAGTLVGGATGALIGGLAGGLGAQKLVDDLWFA